MKRTLALSAVILAAVYAVAAHRAGAQNPTESPSVDAAKQQYRAAVQRGLDFLAEQNSLQGEAGAQAIDRETLREKLRPLVEESFDARQRLQQAEVKELRRQLAEIEQAIQDREKNREVIVNSRVDDLVHGRATSAKSQEPQGAPLPASEINQVGTPPANAPPGTEVRVRFVHEQQNVDGETKTVTRPVYEFVKKQQPNAPQYVEEDSSVASSHTSDDESTAERKGAALDEGAMDIETRARLAQIDFEAAEEGLAAAKRNLDYSRAAFDSGTMPQNRFHESDKEYRQAQYELKRAKIKLEGLARQRAELEAAAAADVTDANAEVRRAMAKVKVAEANLAAAMAQKDRAVADVAAAKANYEYCEKSHGRISQLATVQKAVGMEVLDEAVEKLAKAKATLDGAEAALAAENAKIETSKATFEEMRAEVVAAEMRARAAEARRARLLQRRAPDQPQPEKNMSERSVPRVPVLADMPFLGRLFQSTTSVQ